MRIATVCFDYKGNRGMFKRLADVLAVSAKIHSTIPLETYYIDAPKVLKQKSFHSNTDKLAVWNEIVQDASDDIILMDCDMLLQGCISDGFDFVADDIGYTIADYSRALPFNGGVVFVKNTARAKQIMADWKVVNDKMMKDASFHLPYRQKYAGINQASWGCMLEQGLKVSELPMSVYNLCDNWENKQAKCIHYKGQLRKALLYQHSGLKYWVNLWRKYEKML